MKLKSKRYIIVGLFTASLIGLGVYHSCFFQISSIIRFRSEELATKQLSISALSSQSVWDQKFLAQNSLIKEKIARFEKGELCKALKELNNKDLTHQQMLAQLKEGGFTCVVRPLSLDPSVQPLIYLKIDNTLSQNLKDKGIAHQEICQNRRQPDCVIRIKRDGFPLNKRSLPHSSKAVLVDGAGDSGSYDNEAFKIGSQGQVLPKGPSAKFGLRECPYKKDKRSCNLWVDAIMEEAHPVLNEPMGTK